MPFSHNLLPAVFAILIFGFSRLMKNSAKDSALVQSVSTLFLALSVVAAAVTVALLITK